MSTPSADEERSRLLSDALELAMEVSKEGTRNLSEFLTNITTEASSIADKASQQLGRARSDRLDEFATRGGRLANDAVAIALDVAVAAKEELDRNPAQRDRNLNALAQLVSFAGSVFVDTANKAVGTTAGQPSTDRARQVTVEVAPGGKAEASAWVVNRGAGTVTDAAVHVLHSRRAKLAITCRPARLTISPRGRAQVRLTVTGPQLPAGSFADALLVVDGVGSIVVRTIVKGPDGPAASATGS